MNHSFNANIRTQTRSHINSIWLGPQGGSMRANRPLTAQSSHLTTCVNFTRINSLKPHNICLLLFQKDPVGCYGGSHVSKFLSNLFLYFKITFFFYTTKEIRYASQVSCQHTNITCGCWERQRQTLRRGWRAACQINKLHNNIISSVNAKTANRQAPSGPVSADGALGQQKCVHTVTHAWACTRVDTHERTHGWSSQVNVTEIGLERQLRLCASMCTKTS